MGQTRNCYSPILIFLAVVFCATAFSNDAAGQNLYSTGTGNWDNPLTWSLISHVGVTCACTPGAGNTVLIGNGHIITYRSGIPGSTTITSLTIDDGGGGTLMYGNGAVVTTLTVSGNITINAGGTLQSGATGATLHRIFLGGDLTNSNVFDLTANAATFQVVTFNGGLTQTISGPGGTFSFRGITLSATPPANININSNIRISGAISLVSNPGLLVVGSTSNITLTNTATFAGIAPTRYVQLDGTTGANSQLIRVNSGLVADWQFLFPIGTSSGGYSPLDMSVSTVTTAPVANSTLAVKAIYNSGVIGQLRRTFRLVTAGNTNATTFANANFTFANPSTPDVSQGDVLANYNTIWYLNLATSTWANLAGTAPGATFFTPSAASSLQNGTYYYTIGNSTAYPSTWYTYQTGVWSNPDVWTLDPSGTTLNNPLTQSPNSGDQVVILNPFTVTCDVNNLSLATTTIQGGATLDMGATTGQILGTVSGAGLLRVNGVGLPTGTYNSFVASTGGSIEYYNSSGTIPVPGTNPVLGTPTYNNLLLSNGSNSAITFTLASNLAINTNLNVTQTAGTGSVTWQINDASNAQRTLTLAGDLTVSANGLITAGAGNSAAATPHSFTLSGNLTNNGTIKFFDPTDATYSVANYTSGAVYTSALRGNTVAVTFGGLTSKTVTCNNTTDFYRLILNKGTGQQAMLTVNSSSALNFRLFGPANLGSNTGAAPNQLSDCALSIVNGTLQLTGTITIPILNATGASGNDYLSIPQNGALWINGASVSVTVANNSAANPDQRIMLDGLLRVTNGTIAFGYSKGLGSGDVGIFLMEGGTASMWQFRPRAASVTQAFVFNQSGGTVNIGTTGYLGTPALAGVNNTANARFSLPVASCTFQMSGAGILNIGTPTSFASGGINIASSANNYSVSGGTINAYIPAAGSNFVISSTAPLNNLNIYKEGGGVLIAQTGLALTLLNNLALITANSPTFSCNNLNITVGGNIDVQAGTTFTPGTNTITINGSGAQSWTHNGTITSLNNIVVNKSAGTVTLGGANVFPNAVALTLTSGTLNDGGKTLTVTTTLSNSATHASSGAGAIVANGPVAISGTAGTFGNLTIQTNATVATSGGQTVTGALRLIGASTTLSIGSNSLAATGNIFSDAAAGVAFTNTKRIITNGLRNDGGLTRQATSATDLLFPVGTSTILYTPITINTTATTAGTVTVQPVNGAHPNVTTITQSVRYFWRVSSAGFAGITAVTHKSYTYSNAVRDAASINYRPARYDRTTNTWASGPIYNATAGGGLTTIPNFNTGAGWPPLATDLLDGEYTAGNILAFGAVTVYYSRATGNWSVPATWSTTGHGGAAAGTPPCATCPVEVGNVGFNHTVTNDANGQSCGSLYVDLNSVLDCSTFTGLNFGVNTTGTGKVRIASANFPAGDFINFLAASGGTIEWYGTSYTIPTVGAAPQNINLFNYYNLIISPNAGATITLPGTNLTIYNTLTASGIGTGQVNTDVGAARTLTVFGPFNVSSGTLSLRNGNVTNWVVSGATTISIGATVSLQGGGAQTHTFSTSAGITNNGTLTFKNVNELVNLTFTGSSNTSVTGTNGAAATTLNQVTVNKGTSQTPTLTIGPLAGTVTTPTNNWLILQNGTIIFNVAASTFTLTNVVTNPFSIPATSRLTTQAGTVNISNVAADDSDLLLTGTLEITGGTVNVGAAGNNNNNDIEYASAGLPAITISSGILYVNGAIRRSTVVLAGALVYNQSSGTVTAAGRNCAVAPNNTRGVFEIENNPGSSFTMSGGTLTVSRPTGGSNFTDLNINPASSSVLAASTIQIGDNALGAQTLDINITTNVGSLTVLGAAANAQTVNMVSSPLQTSGTLTINTASILNTNSLDVSMAGDMMVNGTYNGTIGAGNTTTFNGNGAQTATLSATSTFLNMTVNKPSGTVTLGGTAPTVTDLNILNGVLDVFNLNLPVIGNITNNSSQVNTSSGSLSLAGGAAVTQQNITSSGGSFGNMTLTGAAATKNVIVTGDIAINGLLNFATTNRFLTIGSSQLTFGTNATVSGAGATAFVRTNGVPSDLGVVKNWPVAGSTPFTYPLGTLNNYTPIVVTLTVTTAGSLTVIPVNSRHPTYNVASTERILNYYWIITRDNSLVYSATGSQLYQFPSTLMGGSGGTLKAGYLDLSAATLGWNTSDPSGTPVPTTTTMNFTNSLNTNLPAPGVTFHYTVGTINTLPNPITPVYSLLDDANVSNLGIGGSWNVPGSWTASATGHGAPQASAPIGVPVVILSGARINMNVNGRSAFTSQVNGLLVLGTSYGHNMGIMSGTGTMRTATSTFPAGNYTTFVSSAGGTIEYVAPMTMNNRTTYNNVLFSGAGTATMTNSNLTLNGTITIPAGVTVNNANNRNITLARDWSNAGTFTQGTGTVTFNGAVAQGINGTTTFNNLTISKSNNLTLSGTTTVNGVLTLTSGNVVSSTFPAASLLVLASSASVSGGGASSFIDGQVSKTLASGSTFSFPLGSVSATRYRPVTIGSTGGPASDVWTVSYIGHNPTTDGFGSGLFNVANMAKVSQYEYWQVACASGTATASLTLSFGAGSYGGANIGVLASLKTARWTGAQWDLPPGGGTFSRTGTNVTGTVSVSFQNAFSPQTLATDDPTSSLPIELLDFTAKLNGSFVDLNWSTASELNNDFFTIERTADLENFEEVSVVKGQGTKNAKTSYSAVDRSPLSHRSYYRLKQTDYNGNHTFSGLRTIDNTFVDEPLKIYPNPIVENKFTFELSNAKPSEIVILRIVNLQGSPVFEASYKADGNGKIKQGVEISPVSGGLYFVTIISSSGLNRRVVIE